LREKFENEDVESLDQAVSLAQKLVHLHPPPHPKRPTYLSELVAVLKIRMDSDKGHIEDLQRAISSAQEAVEITPTDNENHSQRLNDLALLHLARFERFSNEDDLNLVISLLDNSIKLISSEDRKFRFSSLCDLADALREKFRFSEDAKYLDWAIAVWNEGVAIAETDDIDLPSELANLALALEDRFNLKMDLVDITRAVQLQQKALDLTPDGDFRSLATLGAFLRKLYQHSDPHDENDINAAITNLTEAYTLALSAGTASDRSHILSDLGLATRTRFAFLGAKSDLDDALTHFREALSCSSGGDDQAEALKHLASTLDRKFLISESREELEEAISHLEEAVALASRDAILLINLGDLYRRRYLHFRLPGDIDNAANCLMKAENLTRNGSDDRTRVRCLSNLGQVLLTRMETMRTLEDVENAVNMLTEAMELESKERVYLLASGVSSALLLTELDMPADPLEDRSRLGLAYQHLFELRGYEADLDQSITFLEQVGVDHASANHYNRAAFLSNLAFALYQKFDIRGQLVVLDRAISLLESALELVHTGGTDHAEYSVHLSHCLQARFDHLQTISDLDRAVQLLEKCTDVVQERPIVEVLYRGALGIALMARFKQSKQMTDITRSISELTTASNLLPGDSRRFMNLSNLGSALRLKIDPNDVDTQSLEDLRKAVTVSEEAVSLLGEDRAYASQCLNNLGYVVRLMAERGLADINRAVDIFTKAVDIMPNENPVRATALYGLGLSLNSRAQLSPSRAEDDIGSAIQCFREASSSKTWSSTGRYVAAVKWANLAGSASRLETALEGYRAAIDIVPMLAWRGIDAVSRLNVIRWSQNLVCDAAACAIELNKLEEAVELLDNGRSVFWNQLLEMRTDVVELRSEDPALADNFERVGKDLERATLQGTEALITLSRHPTPLSAKESALHRLAEKWDELVYQIRGKPGFENFLLQSPFSVLRRATEKGPVVIINFSTHRSDALIVTSQRDVFLAPFSDDQTTSLKLLVEKQQHILSSGSGQPRLDLSVGSEIPGSEGGPFKNILHETWFLVGERILLHLKEMDYLGPGKIPRVWWYLTGPFTFLPIHACLPKPDHSGKQGPGMMDLVVPSYTPTISALLRAQQPKSSSPFHMLSVGQSLSNPPLLEVPAEMMAIRALIPSENLTLLEDEDASVASVAAALRFCTWAHFACHAIQHQIHPLDSGLLMHGNHRLTLSTIAETSLANPEFAFLAACETATGSEEVPNESIHLVAGMQFVGFRGVIGTMWSVEDRYALAVVKYVYGELFKNGTMADASEAAFALRLAVQYLRDEMDVPLAGWVPFVHFGF
jgi:tetratricopeptide (TPR) repeat protein